MEVLDAATFGQLAVRCKLITEAQLREGLELARDDANQSVPDLIFLQRALERKSYLTNFQCSKLLKGDTDGYFLGGYRLLYKISSGSFGRVFRADDPRSGRVVAVKVLRRRWSEDTKRIDLFVREGKVGLTLKHPNIVEVLAISQDPTTKQYFLVMEFVEGGNLREILQTRKVLTVAESLRIIDDCASGLTLAYARGITHRDIKLTNVLVSSRGEAKLTDFGLAQMFAGMGSEDEQVDRTVDYAGLEKATDVKSGDVRSDIYFLGCVLYETLTGKSPLVMTRDKHQRMSRRRFDEVLALKPGDVQAPASLFQLCETMMAINPAHRYQTPSQMLDAIKAVRRELDAPRAEGARSGPRTLFLVEADNRLQDALRDKFKELGYRVLLAADPARALDRFRQQPFDALIVDVGTTDEDGLFVFERVVQEASLKKLPCAAICILSEDQADWKARVASGARSVVLVRPVTLKQLQRSLAGLLEGAGG